MYNVYLVNMSGEDGHNTSYKVEIVQKMFIHQLECECIVIVHCLCGSQLLVEGGGNTKVVHTCIGQRMAQCSTLSIINLLTITACIALA